MQTYALFDNGTAEQIILKLLNVEVKETLDIYFQGFRSPKVKESANRGIECAYEAIFSKDINVYLQKGPISITVKGFIQQVDGSSAGIAYAIAFAAALIKDNIIAANVNLPDKVAATGEVEISGDIKEIRNIREKVLGAISINADIMFYPGKNSNELNLLLEKDEELNHAVKDSGIKLKAVDSIIQLFGEIGILPKSLLEKPGSVEHTEIVASDCNHDILSHEDGKGLKLVPTLPKVSLALILIIALFVSGTMLYNKLISSKSPYSLTFAGDGDMITSNEYKSNLENVFYTVYPRLCKRWGTGSEPKNITFKAVNEGGIVLSDDTTIDVGVDFANSPNDLGFLVHELTKLANSYDSSQYPTLVYPDGSRVEWWTDGLASYAEFRYFFWADKKYKQLKYYKEMAKATYNDEGSVYRFDWLGESSKINKGSVDQIQWFFAWMDYNYPTTKDEDGNITQGLIDKVHFAIKKGTYSDQIFVDKTGHTMFELMEEYTKDVNKNGWRFTGFSNYADNWLAEDIDGLVNPDYPTSLNSSLDQPLKTYFDKITDATEGFENEEAMNLFDNNTSTKYCTDSPNPHVIFAMKRPVTVTSYTFTTGNDTSEFASRNPDSWTLYGSNDQNSWNALDRVTKASRSMEGFDYKSYKFIIDNHHSYRYYRLDITSYEIYSTVQLSELSLNGNLSLMDSFDRVIDGTPGKENERSANLFDGDIGTKYCVEDTGSPFVVFSMKQPVTVNSYAITVANDTEEFNDRNPEAWTFYGSNDQKSWNVIDKVSQASNIIDPINYRSYKFTTKNTTSYQYYMLKVSYCNNCGNTFQLADFSLYAD